MKGVFEVVDSSVSQHTASIFEVHAGLQSLPTASVSSFFRPDASVLRSCDEVSLALLQTVITFGPQPCFHKPSETDMRRY
jgi:hypothetical protein